VRPAREKKTLSRKRAPPRVFPRAAFRPGAILEVFPVTKRARSSLPGDSREIPSAPDESAPPHPSRLRRLLFILRDDALCYALAAASALILRLIWPRPGWWIFAWVGLIPLLMALRAREGKRAFAIAWLFGFVYSYLTLGWLNTLIQFNPFIPLGILALGAALGLWIALQATLWRILRRRFGNLAGNLLAAAGWTAIEYLRTLGPYGFPWGVLGVSQQPCVPLLQTASVTGIYGLSYIIVLANGWAADAILSWLAAREARRARPPLPAGKPLFAPSPGASAAPPVRHPAAAAWRRSAIALAALFAAILLLALWGGARARRVERQARELAAASGTLLRVAALQPNVPQSLKWDSYASPDPERREELQGRMNAELFEMLDDLIRREAHLDLVVTPESAITATAFNLRHELQRELLDRAAGLGAPIFLGADDWRFFTREGAPTENPAEAINPETGEPWRHEAFVAAWMIPPDRGWDAAAVYHKTRLVPFGEWLPWFHIIPGLQENIVQIASFTPGEGPVVFPVSARAAPPAAAETASARPVSDAAGASLENLAPPQIRFSSGICFESIFSDLHRKMARAGASLLGNITNDAWYGRSSGPEQHFQFACVRAAETGRPLLRAANTGITALISPAGRVVEQLPFYEKGILITEAAAPPDAPLTFYARVGDLFSLLCLCAAAAALLAGPLLARRRRAAMASAPPGE